MSGTRFQLAILRTAALMVPRLMRREWYTEWSAELWYVPRFRATAFCLGAFWDALWLRRNCPHASMRHAFRLASPWHCLGPLALLALASVVVCSRSPIVTIPGHGTLVMIFPVGHAGRTVRIEQYQAWDHPQQLLFSELAFYETVNERIPTLSHGDKEMSIARASENLFRLLNIPVPTARTTSLVLSHATWRDYFHQDPGVAGRVLQIGGRPVVICGVLPEGAWSLPGRVDAWLLENPAGLAGLPSDSKGFVLARVRQASTRGMFVENADGSFDRFNCVPLDWLIYRPDSGFLLIVGLAGILVIATTSFTRGEYPENSRWRRWIFLAAKLGLILTVVYGAAHFMAFSQGRIHAVLLGAILALRWAIVDQQQRCPVCLRRLANPVRIGQPSQTFLEWYGTEFICTRGHGLLHVPEIATSGYNAQRWQGLDGSWQGLF